MPLEAPSWWYGERIPLAAWGLLPVSVVYGNVVRTRFKTASPYSSSRPVICVGNFTVGGAGKTPVALKIASLLRGLGLQPSFLTRGYGGREKGPRAVESNESAALVGDEALLLARSEITVVSRLRPLGARLLEKLDVDAIVMDDGFQNPSLKKDFNLIVVDGGAGFGCERVFPLGPLRAPLEFQIERADAMLVLGEGAAKERIVSKFGKKPVFQARIVPEKPGEFSGRRVVAFCGIGRPVKFFASLEEEGIAIVKRMQFPDHHYFSEDDAREILNEAVKNGASLMTTEKDYVRLLSGTGAIARLAEAVECFPIAVSFQGSDEARLMRLIAKVLAEKGVKNMRPL